MRLSLLTSAPSWGDAVLRDGILPLTLPHSVLRAHLTRALRLAMMRPVLRRDVQIWLHERPGRKPLPRVSAGSASLPGRPRSPDGCLGRRDALPCETF